MLMLHCPHCDDTREEQEFTCLGEAFIDRPTEPTALSDEQWGEYLFMRSNHKGWTWEQWQHTSACRRIFIVRRHTVSYAISGSYTLANARAAAQARGESQ